MCTREIYRDVTGIINTVAQKRLSVRVLGSVCLILSFMAASFSSSAMLLSKHVKQVEPEY